MTRRKWLILGASGFVGRAVFAEVAQMPDVIPVCIGRTAFQPDQNTIESAIGDYHSIAFWKEILERFRPELIINLAGMTPPGTAQELWDSNYNWILQLLAAIKQKNDVPIRIIHAGSAAELGEVPVEALPVSEFYQPKPVTDYGRSKLAATELLLSCNSSQLRCSVARLFNLCGPGQGTRQAFGRYAKEIAGCAYDQQLKLKVHGFDHRRDFLDIRDAAKAIVSLAISTESDCSGLFHVGRGVSHSIGEGLEIIIRLSGKNVELESLNSPESTATGPRDSIADARKIQSITHWRPEIDFDASLEALWQELCVNSNGL